MTFKSVLHDWPDREAKRLLERARDALAAGGTVLIFERAQVAVRGRTPTYSQIPLLLFFRSYRQASWYEETLVTLGFEDVKVQSLELDMPFSLVTARRGA